MKAAIVKEAGRVVVENIPDVTPGPYEAKVKVLACGFCNATDMKVIAGTWKGCGPMPYVLGHETVGEVISCGERVRNLQVGQRVLQVRMEGVPALGIGTAWGGMVEYALATDCAAMEADGLTVPNAFFRTQQTVPKDMDLRNAVMLITMQEVYSALVSLGFGQGDSILILGDGPVGILMAQSARLLGASSVVSCGHHDERLSLAKAVGATHTIHSGKCSLYESARELMPQKFDYIIDAVGSNEFLCDAVKLIKENGKIGIYGYNSAQRIDMDLSAAPSRFDLRYMIVPDIDTMTAVHDPLVEAIMMEKVNPAQLVTDIFALEDIEQAYQRVASRKTLKTIIDIGGMLKAASV